MHTTHTYIGKIREVDENVLTGGGGDLLFYRTLKYKGSEGGGNCLAFK